MKRFHVMHRIEPMARKLSLIAGTAIFAALALFPPLRWAGNWEPGGPNHRLDRILFGYAPSHEWVGDAGNEYSITERSIESQTCSSAHRAIDWLWLIVEAFVGILLVAVAVLPRSSTRQPLSSTSDAPATKS
jgi:hypothetical protein